MAGDLTPLDYLAYRLFGRYARKNRAEYFDLELALRRANIAVPLDVYVARTLFLSTFGGLSVALVCLISTIFFKLSHPGDSLLSQELLRNAGDLLTSFTAFLPEAIYLFLRSIFRVAESDSFVIVLLVSIAFLATFVSVYLLYRNYPRYRASVRETAINQLLPHAITFMHAMSTGGMSLLDIFRTIHQHQDVYGEVSVEVQAVVQGVELLGLDLISALRQAAAITPSDHLKNFFESTATHMESGGDLTKFLRSRSDQFQAVAAQERKSLLELLSMLAEVYVTAFVAGPLFLITIMVSMGMVSAGNSGQLDLLVYVMIPAGSILFVWLLIAMGLESSNTKVVVIQRKLGEFGDVKSGRSKAARGFKQAELRYRLRRFLDNPAHAFVNNPAQILYFTVPVAALLFLFLAYPYLGQPYYDLVSHLDDFLLLAAAVAVLPFIVFWELRSSRIGKMDAAIPEFLKRLASFNESGLTLAMAIKALLHSNMGVLNSEIRKIWTDIEWGADAREALMRFEYRVNTASIRRVVTLITKASESSGDIKETLSIAAADAAATQGEREERFLNMLLYVSIIYISFFVFLYILYTLSTVFLPVVPGVPLTSQLAQASASTGALTAFTGAIDIQMYKLLFMHAVLLQGLFSGIVAGMMGEGNVYSGLKHSAIMMAIGYVVFVLFI